MMHEGASTSARPSRRRPPSRRSGIVLYVVAVVVVVLSLAGLSYVTVLFTESQAVRLHGDEIQVECLVSSGVESIKAFCELSAEDRDMIGGVYDNPDLFRGVPVLEKSVDGRQGRFSVISPRIENSEVMGMRFGLQNESTRLNLAVLPEWDEEYPGTGREALMALPGMTEAIADAILDWIDADGVPREFGAESDYYSGRGLPYGPRNTVPTSLEELLLVRDVTRELLFGTDANFNYLLDPDETGGGSAPFARGMSGAGLPWASLLTVFSAERNVNPDGLARVNLNSRDLATLYQDLSEVFDDDAWLHFIIAYRQFGPHDEDQDNGLVDDEEEEEEEEELLANKRPRSAAKIDPDLSQPARFRIRSVLDLVDVEVVFRRDGDRRHDILLASPFTSDPSSLNEDLPTLMDWATVEDEPILRGRINVHLAPRPVLASVPGLDDVEVERIVESRASRDISSDPTRRYPTWLLAEGLVDLEQMQDVLPYLTTGGDVYRAQVAGYFDAPGPTGRVEVVIDATRLPPRQIYWKDLRLLGLGYPLEELGAEPTDDGYRFSSGTGRFGRY